MSAVLSATDTVAAMSLIKVKLNLMIAWKVSCFECSIVWIGDNQRRSGHYSFRDHLQPETWLNRRIVHVISHLTIDSRLWVKWPSISAICSSSVWHLECSLDSALAIFLKFMNHSTSTQSRKQVWFWWMGTLLTYWANLLDFRALSVCSLVPSSWGIIASWTFLRSHKRELGLPFRQWGTCVRLLCLLTWGRQYWALIANGMRSLWGCWHFLLYQLWGASWCIFCQCFMRLLGKNFLWTLKSSKFVGILGLWEVTLIFIKGSLLSHYAFRLKHKIHNLSQQWHWL